MQVWMGQAARGQVCHYEELVVCACTPKEPSVLLASCHSALSALYDMFKIIYIVFQSTEHRI